MKENDEEEKEPINIEFTDQIVYPKNAIDLIWLDVQGKDEEDIAQVSLI